MPCYVLFHHAGADHTRTAAQCAWVNEGPHPSAHGAGTIAVIGPESKTATLYLQRESRNKKLLVTSATLVVTGALLVVTMFAINLN